MNKDLKKFILFLIVSIIVAFAISYSYSAYQNYQYEKKIDEVKNTFSFGGTDKKVEDVEENVKPLGSVLEKEENEEDKGE